MPRQSTKLESVGAEFLVLGQLLLRRVAAYKSYTNMPGYDLVATNPDTNRSARIQVKSRWKNNAPFFLIKNFDCDFVVAVRLNRGRRVGGGGGVSEPEYFVLPIELVRSVHRPGEWSKFVFKDLGAELARYRDGWLLISDFLADNHETAGASVDQRFPATTRRRGR